MKKKTPHPDGYPGRGGRFEANTANPTRHRPNTQTRRTIGGRLDLAAFGALKGRS